MSSYGNPILFVALCVLASVAIVTWVGGGSSVEAEARMIGAHVSSFAELRDRFEDLAVDRGARFAFSVLREADLPPKTDLHLLGHAVGDVLYEQEGIAGMSLCTQDFRNACSHSVVVGAFREFGEAALPSIRTACEAAPGGKGAYTMCYHGLGHGIFAYTGYDIQKTVSLCKEVGTRERHMLETAECFGGAIMELMGGGGHDREGWLLAREKYLTGPLAPCTSTIVPDALVPMCLTYLTPYVWERAGVDPDGKDPARWEPAFASCARILDSNVRAKEACYGGFGKEFVTIVSSRDIRDFTRLSDEDMDTIHTWCAAAKVRDGIAYCVRSAAFSFFWGGESELSPAFRFCSRSSAHADACYGALVENIHLYIPEEEQPAMCARLPEVWHTQCVPQIP